MTDITVPFQLFPHGQGLDLPAYATPGSVGLDLRAAVEDVLVIKPGDRVLVPTGIAIALPASYEAQVRPRSGLAVKHGITVLNAPGTIDWDYRGEIKVLLINHGHEEFAVRRGAAIAQLVIAKVTLATLAEGPLDGTSRGAGGFGSTDSLISRGQ